MKKNTVYTIETFDELKRLLSDKEYNNLFDKAIDAFSLENETNREIRYSWDEDDISNLENMVIHVLQESNRKAYSKMPTDTCFQEIYHAIEEKISYDWFTPTIEQMYDSFIASVTDELGGDFNLELDFFEFEEELKNHDVVFENGLREQLMNMTLRVNIPIVTEKEVSSNYNNTHTLITHLKDSLGGLDENLVEQYEQTGLVWLLEQQGYFLEDVYMNEALSEDAKNEFLESVSEEIYNCPDDDRIKLYVMEKIDLNTLLSLLSNEDFTLHLKVDSKFQLGSCGLYDSHVGRGSLLEIKPEKDILLPKYLIGDIQIEGDKNREEFSIDEVYGLVSNCWVENNYEITDESTLNQTVVDACKVNKAIEKMYQYNDYSDTWDR